jgi:hypothetical protein
MNYCSSAILVQTFIRYLRHNARSDWSNGPQAAQALLLNWVRMVLDVLFEDFEKKIIHTKIQ